jgi:hypothetical protein
VYVCPTVTLVFTQATASHFKSTRNIDLDSGCPQRWSMAPVNPVICVGFELGIETVQDSSGVNINGFSEKLQRYNVVTTEI